MPNSLIQILFLKKRIKTAIFYEIVTKAAPASFIPMGYYSQMAKTAFRLFDQKKPDTDPFRTEKAGVRVICF